MLPSGKLPNGNTALITLLRNRGMFYIREGLGPLVKQPPPPTLQASTPGACSTTYTICDKL